MESKQNTCTPADEWSEFETWHEKKYPCDPLTGPSAALRWSGFQAARAAQGAGTAPVDGSFEDLRNVLEMVRQSMTLRRFEKARGQVNHAIFLLQSLVATPTQVSAPQAVPEVLLNAKAVYDELYKTSYCSSLEEVSDVLDAIVRLIRADAPQASASK